MDIEDAHKLKILTTQETQDLLLAYFPDERKAHILDTLKIVSDTNEQIAYLRFPSSGCLSANAPGHSSITKYRYWKGNLREVSSSISPNGLPRPTNIAQRFFQEDIPFARCIGHRTCRLPYHQHLARTDDRCGTLTGKSIFAVAHQPGSGQYNMKATACMKGYRPYWTTYPA